MDKELQEFFNLEYQRYRSSLPAGVPGVPIEQFVTANLDLARKNPKFQQQLLTGFEQIIPFVRGLAGEQRDMPKVNPVLDVLANPAKVTFPETPPQNQDAVNMLAMDGVNPTRPPSNVNQLKSQIEAQLEAEYLQSKPISDIAQRELAFRAAGGTRINPTYINPTPIQGAPSATQQQINERYSALDALGTASPYSYAITPEEKARKQALSGFTDPSNANYYLPEVDVTSRSSKYAAGNEDSSVASALRADQNALLKRIDLQGANGRNGVNNAVRQSSPVDILAGAPANYQQLLAKDARQELFNEMSRAGISGIDADPSFRQRAQSMGITSSGWNSAIDKIGSLVAPSSIPTPAAPATSTQPAGVPGTNATFADSGQPVTQEGINARTTTTQLTASPTGADQNQPSQASNTSMADALLALSAMKPSQIAAAATARKAMPRRGTNGAYLNPLTGMPYVASPLDLPGIQGQKLNAMAPNDPRANATLDALAGLGTAVIR